MGWAHDTTAWMIPSEHLALHFYRTRQGRRGLGTASRGGTVTPTPAPSVPDPNACAWCKAPLDALETAAANEAVVVYLGRLCRRCAAKQERVR